jgi:hypothetical protein
MHSKKENKTDTEREDEQLNSDFEGVDKAPGEEKGKKEKVTTKDLKGKKVDADPAKESDKPAD